MARAMNWNRKSSSPVPKESCGRPEIWPFSTLDVGDHFFFPIGHDTANARSLSAARGRTLRRKFSVHKTDSGRLRVERIA